MTQLWETGLTRSGEQLQPQAKLWTASPQAVEAAVTRFTWKKGSVILKKKKKSVCSGASSKALLQGLAGRCALALQQKLRLQVGCQPLPVFPPSMPGASRSL